MTLLFKYLIFKTTEPSGNPDNFYWKWKNEEVDLEIPCVGAARQQPAGPVDWLSPGLVKTQTYLQLQTERT